MVAVRSKKKPHQESVLKTLRREICSLLAAKLLALAVMFFVFFGPSERPDIDAESVKDAILSQTEAKP